MMKDKERLKPPILHLKTNNRSDISFPLHPLFGNVDGKGLPPKLVVPLAKGYPETKQGIRPSA
jgi:hypothetical protein